MQAFINYVSFPMSARQLENKIDDDGITDMESLLRFRYQNWTISPKAKEGDLVVFYHTSNVLDRIKSIEQEAKQNDELYKKLKHHIDLAYEYFEKYGKTIFGVGVVESEVEYDEDSFDYQTHFKTRCFADIESIQLLETPISTKEFLSFFDLKNQKSSEPIERDTFKKLIAVIKETNKLSPETIEYFEKFEKE